MAERGDKRGLRPVDLVSIVLVIAFLGLMFTALVMTRSGDSGRQWAERVTRSVDSWIVRAEAEAGLSPVAEPAR